jgi:hypothetical protein
VRTVRGYIDTPYNKEAWTLLAIISEGQNIKDVDFAIQYFKKKDIKLKKVRYIYTLSKQL